MLLTHFKYKFFSAQVRNSFKYARVSPSHTQRLIPSIQSRFVLAIEFVSFIQFLLLTMSLAEVSTVPAEVVARQVKVPVSSS